LQGENSRVLRGPRIFLLIRPFGLSSLSPQGTPI
jgi:hypothetical protein